MNAMNRRTFIKGTAAAAAALSIPARSWAQVSGSNSDVRIAVIGSGDRGTHHISEWAKMSGVRITALCDTDKAHAQHHVESLKKLGKDAEPFTDIRKLLESKNIDAVSIATPNHWHSLAAIWAIQAGKDVYVEKPVSHNVFEGRKVVEAARKYNKIVQTGTQSRSSMAIREAAAWLKEGNLGKIQIARGLCYKPRPSIGKVDGAQPIPPGIDYDLWCGPAEKLPLMRKKLHCDWHWVWNTGNGDLGNQGIHQMDIARWFLGEMMLAPRVLSVGGRLGYIDDGETANTQFVYQEYEKAPLIFEVRGLPRSKADQKDGKWSAKEMDKLRDVSIGVIVECEGGTVVTGDGAGVTARDKDGNVVKQFKGGVNHFENFVKALHSRKSSDLNADILEGHLSSALCHTGNISLRLGAKKNSAEIREAIKSDKGLAETFGRMTEHLAKNGVDIDKDQLTLGVPLKMDAKAEKFIGNEQANAMLTRPYRAPYIVPDKV